MQGKRRWCLAAVAMAAWVLSTGVEGGALEPGQFYTRGPAGAKRVALTLDDGPGPETAKFLQLLDQHGVKATFFMLGELAEMRPEQVKAVQARGHEVASHTWNHVNYKEHQKKVQAKVGSDADAVAQSRRDLVADMRRTQAAIEKSTGRRVGLCRMPHGIDRPWVRDAAKEAGVVLVNWTYGADWNAGTAEDLTPGYVKALQPGAVFLLHDGGNKRAKSIQILDALIRAGKQQGYEFVTVGQLLGGGVAGAPASARATGTNRPPSSTAGQSKGGSK